MLNRLAAAVRAAPITGALLRWRYKRSFFHMTLGTGCWFGEFPSFEAAAASIPAGAPQGYDHATTANLYEDMLDRVADTDYPALFWLSRVIDARSHVVDLGGHVGVKYYAYRPYLTPMPERWTVCDVPAVVQAGAERARARGEAGLDFTTDFSETSTADVLFTQGALQYIDTPLATMVGGLARKPKHIIINRVPTAAEREYITLQNIGVTYCPYRIAREGAIAEALVAAGYELVDSWENASEARTQLPYSSASRLRWMGHYLRLA